MIPQEADKTHRVRVSCSYILTVDITTTGTLFVLQQHIVKSLKALNMLLLQNIELLAVVIFLHFSFASNGPD